MATAHPPRPAYGYLGWQLIRSGVFLFAAGTLFWAWGVFLRVLDRTTLPVDSLTGSEALVTAVAMFYPGVLSLFFLFLAVRATWRGVRDYRTVQPDGDR